MIESFYGKVGTPLRSKQSLKIGYGGGDANAFDFYIADGQDVDISFLKLILSTKPVNLEDIECGSPFLSTDHATKSAPPVNVDEWGSILIPIVLKRRNSRQV